VEDRWQPDLSAALAARRVELPPRLGCIEAFNIMRGCPLHFSIYATGRETLDPGCRMSAEYSCKGPLPASPDTQSRCR